MFYNLDAFLLLQVVGVDARKRNGVDLRFLGIRTRGNDIGRLDSDRHACHRCAAGFDEAHQHLVHDIRRIKPWVHKDVRPARHFEYRCVFYQVRQLQVDGRGIDCKVK